MQVGYHSGFVIEGNTVGDELEWMGKCRLSI